MIERKSPIAPATPMIQYVLVERPWYRRGKTPIDRDQTIRTTMMVQLRSTFTSNPKRLNSLIRFPNMVFSFTAGLAACALNPARREAYVHDPCASFPSLRTVSTTNFPSGTYRVPSMVNVSEGAPAMRG